MGNIARSTPRWWVVLWSVWGTLVAGLVLLLDPQPWLAVPWVLGGGMVGLFGVRVLRPFADPLLEWYQGWNPDRAALRERLFRLLCEGNDDSEEYKRCMAEDFFWTCLAVPPLFGLLHGTLLGGLVGALVGSDGESGIPASTGATLGMVIGPVWIACVASLTLACIVDVGKWLPLPVRLARRGLLLVSPLLIVPVTWHCLRRLSRRIGGPHPARRQTAE